MSCYFCCCSFRQVANFALSLVSKHSIGRASKGIAWALQCIAARGPEHMEGGSSLNSMMLVATSTNSKDFWVGLSASF